MNHPSVRGTEVSIPFWESVEAGRVKLPFCESCKSFFFYPRSFCPDCWSEQVTWQEISGFGTIWSFTEVNFPFFRGEWKEKLPYVVSLVELDEGVRILSNVTECPAEKLRIGMKVQMTFNQYNKMTMPLFKTVN